MEPPLGPSQLRAATAGGTICGSRAAGFEPAQSCGQALCEMSYDSPFSVLHGPSHIALRCISASGFRQQSPPARNTAVQYPETPTKASYGRPPRPPSSLPRHEAPRPPKTSASAAPVGPRRQSASAEQPPRLPLARRGPVGIPSLKTSRFARRSSPGAAPTALQTAPATPAASVTIGTAAAIGARILGPALLGAGMLLGVSSCAVAMQAAAASLAHTSCNAAAAAPTAALAEQLQAVEARHRQEMEAASRLHQQERERAALDRGLLQCEMKHAQTKVAEAKMDLAWMKGELAQLQGELTAAREEADALRSGLHQVIEQAAATLEEEHDQAQAQLAAAEREKQHLLSKLHDLGQKLVALDGQLDHELQAREHELFERWLPDLLLGRYALGAQRVALRVALGGRDAGWELEMVQRIKPAPHQQLVDPRQPQLWRARQPIEGSASGEKLDVAAKTQLFDPSVDDLDVLLAEAVAMGGLAALQRGAAACSATGVSLPAPPVVVPLLRVYARRTTPAERAAHGLPYELVQLYRWLPRGDLYDSHVYAPRYAAQQPLPLGEVRRVLVQQADAYCQLHAVGFVEGDGKNANKGVEEGGHVQLFDLGGGVWLPHGADRWYGRSLYTPEYASPEQLTPQSAAAFLCRGTDIYTWAVGASEMVEEWIDAGGDMRLATPLLQLIAQCKEHDPCDRPSAAQVLERLLAWEVAQPSPLPQAS